MLRYASLKDLEFIYELVIDGAKGHCFDQKLLDSEADANFFKQELKSIISKKKRISGELSYALIYEVEFNKIGFIIMTAISENSGNELWMASIDPKYRKKGFGKKMIVGLLNQFKGKNQRLLARCSDKAEVMHCLLLKNGFINHSKDKQYHCLIYTL